MSSKCVVPNCTNATTTGLAFPQDEELKIKWLKSLNLDDFVPSSTSFVCRNHFSHVDIIGKVFESSLEEDLPLPTINIVKRKTNNCRLCLNAPSTRNITNSFNSELSIAKAIKICIPELATTIEADQADAEICDECFAQIKNFHTFRTSCIAKNAEAITKRGRKRKRANSITTKVEIDKKFDKVEELMEALEGKLPDEMKNDDNIIIQVQSDDENEIKTVENSDETIFEIGEERLKLPKGIKVVVNYAKIGERKINAIKSLAGIDFCEIDGYIFEFGLKKESVQFLKCLNGRCRTEAEQIIETTIVTVKSSHNHPVPTEIDIKKQMFVNVMRKKLLSDKTLNFRQLYDSICKLDPQMKQIVPLKTMISLICTQQAASNTSSLTSFENFYANIEGEMCKKLHYTHLGEQFYQEKFRTNDGTMAVLFANRKKIQQLSSSKIMYVDASFKISTTEKFNYHLVTALVWCEESFYPIVFALVSEKSQEMYKTIFGYLHDTLAPDLRPTEIVTDYEACLYYSLAETYMDSHIGGSIFYFAQNLYKKICSLRLSQSLDNNTNFRNIYHMLLMLPLLPVNTIEDGLANIETQANDLGQADLMRDIFKYVREQWMEKVTPELFCVHRLENRINENVIAPFKKLRDLLMVSKSRIQKQSIMLNSVEKIIELEKYLDEIYLKPSKSLFARDISCTRKKNVIRAWQFIECHPKINIDHFFHKVIGYIKCMENQLWIWGFYRYEGDVDDELISATNFAIINDEENEECAAEEEEELVEYICEEGDENDVVLDVMIDKKNGFLVEDSNVILKKEVI